MLTAKREAVPGAFALAKKRETWRAFQGDVEHQMNVELWKCRWGGGNHMILDPTPWISSPRPGSLARWLAVSLPLLLILVILVIACVALLQSRTLGSWKLCSTEGMAGTYNSTASFQNLGQC
jgi:hypothetical protein